MDNISENEEGKTYCPSTQVFCNDLLREIILEHAIKKVDTTKRDQPEDGQHRNYYFIKEISRFRLVSKSSLDTISKLLRRRNVELKFLTWMPGRYSNSTFDKEMSRNRKKLVLEKVVSLFSSPDHLDQLSVLPFALSFDKQIFRVQHQQNLEYCLKHCSRSLTSLSLEFPTNVRTPTLNANSVFFPCLRTFAIHWPLVDEEEGTKLDENSNGDNVLFFIQTILDGTGKLETFELTYSSYSSRGISLIPVNFKNLLLPKTLTNLNLLGKYFDLLHRNELPKLHKLTMDLCDDVSPIRTNQASEILEKYRDTLTFLKLRDDAEVSTKEHANIGCVKLPLMEKLESLEVQTGHFSFTSSLSGLEKCLPNLKSFVVTPVLANMWKGLLENSGKFATVIRLDLALTTSEEIEIDRDGDIRYPGGYINMNVDQMRLTCAAFPNLQRLEIRLSPEGMRIVFRELRQLKELCVWDWDSETGVYEWTKVLLGITSDECFRLNHLCRKSVFKWNDIEVNREENAVSILNLTELTSFEFESNRLFMGAKYLAYIVFYAGFMKMPSLSKLWLDCCFKTTPQMIQEWTEKGSIYSCVPSYGGYLYWTDSSDDE